MRLMEASDSWSELTKWCLYEDSLTLGKQSRERHGR